MLPHLLMSQLRVALLERRKKLLMLLHGFPDQIHLHERVVEAMAGETLPGTFGITDVESGVLGSRFGYRRSPG